MKQVMFIIGFLLGSFLLFSSFSLRENPQDPPRGKKGEKATRHIRLEKIENGEKTVLDTVIESDRVFVWNGDTIGSVKEMKWIGKENFEMDSIHKNFQFRFFDSDSEDDNPFIFAPHPPKVPHVVRLNKKLHGNVIDLGDPGIISYKKKKMSGGREKIVIIRKEPPEPEIEEDVVIKVPDVPGPAVWMNDNSPEKVMVVRKKIRGETEDIEVEMEEKEEKEQPENN